jgi:PilZ domain-containing protein
VRSDFTKRAARVDVRRPAILIDSDGCVSEVTILDISRSGFRIQISESPRVGERVTLRVEHDDEFPAQIRWVLGGEAGGIFLPSPDDGQEIQSATKT